MSFTETEAGNSGPIAVALALNPQYVQHACAALHSLLINNRKKSFSAYVINSGIPERTLAKLKKVASDAGNCKVINLVVSDTIYDELILTHYYSREIYFRLLIPELIDEERVLYLDSDLIVNDSIEQLMECDISDVYIAAVKEPLFNRHKELGLQDGHRYFNSGVMLINNRKWKEDGLHRKVIEYIAQNKEVIRFPDQDGLNAIIGSRYLPLPLKYNLTFIPGKTITPEKGLYGREELDDALHRPVIIHFSGGSKPWHVNNRHPYKSLYWNYLRKTPYRYTLPTEMKPKNIIRALMPRRLKSGIKTLLGSVQSSIN